MEAQILTPKTVKKTAVIDSLRSLGVGNSVIFTPQQCKAPSVRQAVTRLQAATGFRFKATEKEINGIKVTREQ